MNKISHELHELANRIWFHNMEGTKQRQEKLIARINTAIKDLQKLRSDLNESI